jgi:hypothetical protein
MTGLVVVLVLLALGATFYLWPKLRRRPSGPPFRGGRRVR